MLKLLSLFSGIGAFEKALDNLGVEYDLVGFCEIDKYASKSYSAIHDVPETMNLGDITKVDENALPKDIDLITYGFPCQDISLSGKQKGLFNEDGSLTRSGLFFEALRIIEATKPKVAIAENVKNLVGKKFKEQFRIVLQSLEEAGYNNYWKVLNAKDFGIPQNRERVFIVSIRKDIDTGIFQFPEPYPLTKRLRDVLETEVDEKYYLSDKMVNYLHTITEKNKARGNGNVYVPTNPDGVSKTITTREGARVKDNFIEEPTVKQIGNLMPSKTRANPNQGRLCDKDGLSLTLGAMQGGSRQPFITVDDDSVKVREATKQGYAEAYEGDSINIEQPNSTTRRGRVGKQVSQTLTTSPHQAIVEDFYKSRDARVYEDVSPTLRADRTGLKVVAEEPIVWDGYNQRIRADQSCVGTLTQNCGADLKRNGQGIIEAVNPMPDGTCRTIKSQYGNTSRANFNYSSTFGATEVRCGLRIRKLTPKECFRLMGFDDESFHEAEAVNSNTQLYKQAGNSIVVDVLEELLCMMLDEDGEIFV